MGKRGPRPLPAPLRLLHGQTRAGQNVNRQRPRASGKPSCPPELSADAKAIWKRLVRGMPPQLYTKADEATLAAFCTTYAEHLYAAQTIQDEGRVLEDRYGRRYAHPAMRQMTDTARLIASLGSMLGLNPSGRDALRMPENQQDDWEGLLR